MTEFVLILFMNGWPVEVDRFKNEFECIDRAQQFNRASLQSENQFKVWCEKRKNAPTT